MSCTSTSWDVQLSERCSCKKRAALTILRCLQEEAVASWSTTVYQRCIFSSLSSRNVLVNILGMSKHWKIHLITRCENAGLQSETSAWDDIDLTGRRAIFVPGVWTQCDRICRVWIRPVPRIGRDMENKCTYIDHHVACPCRRGCLHPVEKCVCV